MTTQHKHYETVRRAYYWMSFNPERRAISECASYDAQLAEFATLCGEDTARYEDIAAKFEKKWLAWIGAESRCASSAVTGGSNFPVERNRKRLEIAHKRSVELLDWCEKVQRNLTKTESDAISSDNDNAIPLLAEKLAKLKDTQAKMVAANKIIRGKSDAKISALMELLEITEEKARKLLDTGNWWGAGFAPFSLTNNNAKIKAAESRLAQLKRAEARVTVEKTVFGVLVRCNAEENRLQLVFDGKPSEAVRSICKARGFKWSPKAGAWQRMWNSNGVYAVENACKQIQQLTIGV
jgi:hypothetical protein